MGKTTDQPAGPTGPAATDQPKIVHVQGTPEQREKNQAAIEWLREWRAQPPVEGEMSWEEFEKLMRENAMSPRNRAND